MLQYSTLLQRTILFLSLIVLISQIQLSQAASKDHFINTDSNESADEQRRAYDLKQLRHFLLTSNAEQRAAKREQRNFLKRKLVRKTICQLKKNTFSIFRLMNIFNQLMIPTLID